MSKIESMKMRKIGLKLLINLSKKFFEKREENKEKEERRKRGRPKRYPDYLILALLLFKTSQGLSFRELEEVAKEEVDEKIPDFSSLFYRFKVFDEGIIKEFISFIGEEVMKMEGRREFRYEMIYIP